jgi:hypothetical protein
MSNAGNNNETHHSQPTPNFPQALTELRTIVLQSTSDASKFEQLVLGLIFLRYLDCCHGQCSGSFPIAGVRDPVTTPSKTDSAPNLEASPVSHWPDLVATAKSTELGTMLEDLVCAHATSNPVLRNFFPIDQVAEQANICHVAALVELIDGIGIGLSGSNLTVSLAAAFEEATSGFNAGRQDNSAQYFTPRNVRQLFEPNEPFVAVTYQPTCGSGGIFSELSHLLGLPFDQSNKT